MTTHQLQHNDEVNLQQPQNVQSNLHGIVKVEHDIDASQCTSLNTSTIMRDEIIVSDTDIPNLIKEEPTIEETEATPSDFSIVIKEEPVTDGLDCTVADVDTGMTEKVFLKEPDEEQFLDEVI